MKKLAVLVLIFALMICMSSCANQLEGNVGDTLKNSTVEITVTDFGFAEEGVSVDPDHPDVFCKPIPFPYELTGNEAYDTFVLQASEGLYVKQTEEKCVIYLEYTVKNIGKKDLIGVMIMPSIQFNGSETYSFNVLSPMELGETNPATYDTIGGKLGGMHFYQRDSSWEASPMFWTAGQEYLCRGVAKLPVDVALNTDAPLALCFNVPTANGNGESFTVTIR